MNSSMPAEHSATDATLAFHNANPYTRSGIYDRSLGALLLGANFQCITYGVLLGMGCTYYKRSGNDSRWLRMLVLLAWLLCTLCCAIMLHGIYWFTIVNYDNPSALQRSPWSVSLLPIMMSSVMAIVRLVFLTRVYKLYKAKRELSPALALLMLLVALLSFADFGGAAAITAEFFMTLDVSGLANIQNIFKAMFSVGIAADVILTALLCVSLHSSRSGLDRTDSIINLLILYTIRTGVIACGCAIATLIGFVCRPRALVYAPFYVQTGNLYLVSLLAALNYRKAFRQHIEQPLSLDCTPFDDCALSSERRHSGTVGALSTDVPVSLTTSNSRLSLSKSLRIFRLDSRKKSVGSDYGASEKGQVYHQHREPSVVILDSVVDIQPSDSSE